VKHRLAELCSALNLWLLAALGRKLLIVTAVVLERVLKSPVRDG
jgi:hypothetical protein